MRVEVDMRAGTHESVNAKKRTIEGEKYIEHNSVKALDGY